MSFWDFLAIALAGFGAGVINTLAGAGTLLTFPVLMWLGVPPLAANISNTLGLVAGGFSGTWGYRSELKGQGRRAVSLTLVAMFGAILGVGLLLVLPAKVFTILVPVLIMIAVGLVIAGPRLQARIKSRPSRGAGSPRLAKLFLGCSGVYGGYFGAAQGILHLGVLGAFFPDTIQRLNGLKNIIATGVNLCTSLAFIGLAQAQIQWRIVLALGIGGFLGGQCGATVGKWLSAAQLRWVIIMIGLCGAGYFIPGSFGDN